MKRTYKLTFTSEFIYETEIEPQKSITDIKNGLIELFKEESDATKVDITSIDFKQIK